MRAILIFFTLAVGLTARAADYSFESGQRKTHLIELFTSQGCSSCPPAEAWLSKLKSEPGLWKDFVPIAFHVDYWDRLGWRDPFASKDWTARQYQYSENWKSESVYTPGFVLESSGSLAPMAWMVVSNSPIRIGGQYLVPLRMPGTSGEATVSSVLGHVPPDMTFHPTRRRYPVMAWKLPNGRSN